MSTPTKCEATYAGIGCYQLWLCICMAMEHGPCGGRAGRKADGAAAVAFALLSLSLLQVASNFHWLRRVRIAEMQGDFTTLLIKI